MKVSLSLCFNITELVSQDKADMTFVVLLLLYLFFLMKWHPFKILQLNRLDFFSNVSIVMSKVISIIAETKNLKYGWIKIICMFCYVGVNCVFFCIVIYFFFKYNDWKLLYTKAKTNYGKFAKRNPKTNHFKEIELRTISMKNRINVKQINQIQFYVNDTKH